MDGKESLGWKLYIGVRSLSFSVFTSFYLVITILLVACTSLVSIAILARFLSSLRLYS